MAKKETTKAQQKAGSSTTKAKSEKKVIVLTDVEKAMLEKALTIDQASELLPKVSKSKFIGAVNIDIVLNLKEKQKKESIRGNVTLPHSMGDEKKVIVICEEKDKSAALKAGADKAGLEVVD